MTPTVDPTPTPEPTEPAGLLKPPAAAKLCGVSVSTWKRMRDEAETPPHIALRGMKLWCREELEAWMREGCPPRKKWMPIWAAIKAKRK